MRRAMHFSTRAAHLAESATLKVFRRARELRAAGREIIDLSAGEPDFPSPPAALEAAHRALDEGFTHYTIAAGTPELRRALAARYERGWDAPWRLENVLVTVGAKAALYELFNVLVDTGDEVIIPSPAWVSFAAQVELAGGSVVFVPTRAEESFAIRAAPILTALTERTRLVLLNSPSNPTGGILGAAELRRIVETCAARGIFVLCDETYERFLYDGADLASGAALAAEFPEHLLLVGSFSKTYSMTGWRVGFALGPEAVIRKAAELQGHITSNPTSFAMRGALAALEGSEVFVEQMLAAFTERRELLVAALGRLPGVSCQPPAGAFYAFPNVAGCYRPGREGSIAFAEHLLESAGVAVVPGAAFGADEHVRMSFACSIEDLQEGLERIRRVLEERT